MSRVQIAFLLLVGGVLFFANIWGYDLWPPDEPRFGEVAREMRQSGDYLVPRVNGQPYKEKPPQLFWAIAAASAPFGDVTEFSARVPSGLAALAVVLLTYLLGAQLYGARTGLWAALILMTSSLFWWEARTVRTDMLLTLWMTVALWAFYRWHESRQPGCPSGRQQGCLRERRGWWPFMFYAAIAAGLYTKGPPALAFPLLLVFAFYWKQRDDRRKLHLLWGLAGGLVLILLWLVPARMAAEPAGETDKVTGDLMSVVVHQVVGRALLGVSKAQPPWYYLINLPVGLLPWTVFLPWAALFVWKRRHEGAEMRMLLSWIVPAFVFFSICVGKRAIYLLPIYPALAILMARSVLALVDADRTRWRTGTATAWAALVILFAVLTSAVPFYLRITEYDRIQPAQLAPLAAVAWGVTVAVLLVGLTGAQRRLHVAASTHFIVTSVACAFVVFPAINPYKSARWICEPVRELSERGQEFRLYSVGFSREEYVFYARHFHEPALTDLLPIQTPEPLGAAKMAKLQKRLRDAITGPDGPVGEVPIASMERVTPDEVAALHKAVEKALATAGAEADLAARFETALIEATRKLMEAFDSPTPAFMFVQEEDWRWLLPLDPDLQRLTLIRKGIVGRREVLLLTNQAGAELGRNLAAI